MFCAVIEPGGATGNLSVPDFFVDPASWEIVFDSCLLFPTHIFWK